MMRQLPPAPEQDSIFGNTYGGVPNPMVTVKHGYPTRYHGAIFTQPQAGWRYTPATYAKVPFLGFGADTLTTVYSVASITAGVLGAYHGYKRTGSAGWAFLWSTFGVLTPMFSLPLMAAQGFAKRK